MDAPAGSPSANRILGEAQVKDPYADGATRKVVRNVADSPAARMLARGDINAVQFQADLRFRDLYERLTVANAMAVDPGRVSVDVSANEGPDMGRAIDAGRELARIAGRLGKIDYAILVAVSGQGLGLREVAARWDRSDRPNSRTLNYLSRRFRDALLQLAAVDQ